ncbi:MAG TPA: EAL domain-containing protein [Gallionella sp.]
MRLTLTKKIIFLLLIPLFGSLVSIAFFAAFLEETKNDGHFMNVAGRQRMLSAELRTWANMVAIGQEEDRAGLQVRIAEFEKSLSAMERGGEVLGGLLVPAPPEVRSELTAVDNFWRALKLDLTAVAVKSRGEPQFQEAYRRVESGMDELKGLSQQLVIRFDERTQRLRQRMFYTLIGAACLIGIVFLSGVFLARRYIVQPILRIGEAAKRISGGDFSSRLEIATRDELSTLAHTFNQMVVQTEQLLSALNLRRRRADDIIASLPAGLIVVNNTLKVRSVNRTFREMFGLKNGEDVSGRELADILPLPDLRQQAQAVLAGGIALRGIDAALGEKWLRLTITGIRLAEEEEEEDDLLVVVEDITELKAQAVHIEQLAFYDPLTGLPNRSLLRDRVQRALTHSTRHKNHGAILFIDLDNFKALNDTKGHNIGDLLLIEAAKRLQDCIRSGDTVARLGGDEFVVVLDELNENTRQAAAQAQDIGEKVLASLNQPFNLQGFEHYSSASIGISLFRDNEISIDDLFRHADTAMYQAKTSGRNTLRFFDPDMQASLEARAKLEADLHHALSQRQFKLFFQIQVNAVNHPIGAEALLRWLHPERGLVSPLQFIPLAEDTGLILPIGQWVLETACAQIKAWETNPLACELQLAVNVSARQFHQPDFVEQIRATLKKTGADPARLKLELTESVVLGNIDNAVAKMHELKGIGVHFSMDDFGTGYSSLSYLTQLPLDQLKIDQSFVRNIGIKPTDAVIVQTIIGMGNSLGMEVIAEGVETEAQRDFLERNGCHAYQGYLFSKPVPIEEFETLIRRMPN